MSYKYSKGSTVQGDIKAADDTNRDTMIDFGEDRIDLQTHGSTRFKISGSNGEITFNEAYKFPTADGNADQVLQTNGSGQLSFVDVDGGGGGGGGGSGGKVLQVIHTAFTASTEINATTFATISGFEATITPSATSSKILIHIHANVGLDGIGTDRYGVIKVFRNVSGNSNFVMGGKGPLSGQQDNVVFNTISTDPTTTHERNLVYSATGLDSPNTTNAITYQVRARVNANGTPVMAVNRTTANPANFFHSPAASSITLMEIDGS